MAAVAIIIWSTVTSFVVLKLIDVTIGLRLTLEEELFGADYCEHNVELDPDVKEYAESVLRKLKEKLAREKDSNGNITNNQANGNVQHGEQEHDRRQESIRNADGVEPIRNTDGLIAENLNDNSDDESKDNDDKRHKKDVGKHRNDDKEHKNDANKKKNNRQKNDTVLNGVIRKFDGSDENAVGITSRRPRKSVAFVSDSSGEKLEGDHSNPALQS